MFLYSILVVWVRHEFSFVGWGGHKVQFRRLEYLHTVLTRRSCRLQAAGHKFAQQLFCWN